MPSAASLLPLIRRDRRFRFSKTNETKKQTAFAICLFVWLPLPNLNLTTRSLRSLITLLAQSYPFSSLRLERGKLVPRTTGEKAQRKTRGDCLGLYLWLPLLDLNQRPPDLVSVTTKSMNLLILSPMSWGTHIFFTRIL